MSDEQDDYVKAKREEAQEALRDKHLFEGLVANPAWKRLTEMMERNLRARELSLVYGECQDRREEDIDRGYCQAVKLVLQMPELVIRTSQETIQLAEELDDGERDTE